jgi:hypothetical protein
MKTKLDQRTVLDLLEKQERMSLTQVSISRLMNSYHENDGWVETTSTDDAIESYEIKEAGYLYYILSSISFDFCSFMQGCTLTYYIENLPLSKHPMLLEIEHENNELVFKIGAETVYTILIDEEDRTVITENQEIVFNFFKCYAYELIKGDDEWHHVYSQINDSRIEEFIQKHTHLVDYVLELN